MFTGIVQRKGQVVELARDGKHGRLVLSSDPFDHQPKLGDSIAVSGICLTLTGQEDNRYAFDVLGETFDRTNLGERSEGDLVNLEPSLNYGDPMGGHIVTGHIDAAGRVQAIEPAGERDHILRIECPPEIAAGMVTKGSVALDGVSLTLVDVLDEAFSVHIIPHTWEETSFHRLEPGSRVNIENDILTKYVLKHIEGREDAPLAWEIFERIYPGSAG